jgi:cyclic pyranopterin monophosphate synthase
MWHAGAGHGDRICRHGALSMKPKPYITARPDKVEFSHLDEHGAARMVDVGAKPVQQRRAVAAGVLVCQPATIRALRSRALPKGDVLAVARVAAVQAVKRTADLIPLCHPIPVEHVEVSFRVGRDRVAVTCTVATGAKTGVEMEALTGVSVAALTLYDMCKAVDQTMRIEGIRVLEKAKA